MTDTPMWEEPWPRKLPREKVMTEREALELIATPQRPDGTWNRDREACRQIAAHALACGVSEREKWESEIRGVIQVMATRANDLRAYAENLERMLDRR